MTRPELRTLEARAHRHLIEQWGAPEPPTATDVVDVVASLAPLLSLRDLNEVAAGVLARTSGYGPLDELLRDEGVTEVMVNGPAGVWIEVNGRLVRTELTLDRQEIETVVERILAPLGRRVDRSSPLVDARLADGSRINVAVPPLAIDGPIVTIRRFAARAVELGSFCCPGVAELLAWAVRARMNLLISGGTGAGKTTLLNALAGRIPPGERVVTIEDAAELQLPGEHVVRLESRPGNTEGLGSVTVRDLVRNALRMRPDRIIVGEVRGPEALDMLQAMNTGHEGSLSTCHANSTGEALARIETMVLMGEVPLPLAAVRRQISSAIDLIVQVARTVTGERKLVDVAELACTDDGRPLLALADAGGLLRLPRRQARRPGAGAVDKRWLAV